MSEISTPGTNTGYTDLDSDMQFEPVNNVDLTAYIVGMLQDALPSGVTEYQLKLGYVFQEDDELVIESALDSRPEPYEDLDSIYIQYTARISRDFIEGHTAFGIERLRSIVAGAKDARAASLQSRLVDVQVEIDERVAEMNRLLSQLIAKNDD